MVHQEDDDCSWCNSPDHVRPDVEPLTARGPNRRDFLYVGLIGGLGLTLGKYLGMGNAFRLAQPEFADRLVRALSTRLRAVHESALAEVELWNKSAAAQLDAQLRERRRNFSRRLEAIERIQQAATGLDDRIGEIEAQDRALDALDAKLLELTRHLVATPAPDPHPAPQLQRA